MSTRGLAVRVRMSISDSIGWVQCNPTVANMASYFLDECGPGYLPKEVKLVAVRMEETRKCSVLATRVLTNQLFESTSK